METDNLTPKVSTEKKTFCDYIDSLLKYTNYVKEYVQSSISDIEKQSKTIVTEAGSHRDKLIEQINKSFEDFSREVTNKAESQKSQLIMDNISLDQIIKNLSSKFESFHQTDKNKKTRFLSIHLVSSEKVAMITEKIKCIDLKVVNIKCVFNMNIQPLVETNSKFGEINLEKSVFQNVEIAFPDIQNFFLEDEKEENNIEATESAFEDTVGGDMSGMKLRKIDKINVKMNDDTRDCYMRGIDITDEGNIIFADFNNSKIKLFAPDGNYISALKLVSKPKEVTVIKGSQAVVSMFGKQMCKHIGIIDIEDSGQLTWKGTIKTANTVGGIVSYDGNLIVTCDESDEKLRAVQMINMDGCVLWSVEKDKTGNSLFDFGRFLAIRCSDDGDTIIVTDVGKQSITFIDAPTGEVIEVCTIRGKEPRGVCVDSQGDIYICYKSGEITEWSSDVSEEKCVISKSDQMNCPLAMVYDHRRSELLVTSSSLTESQYCNFVHRYKISRKLYI